MLAEKVANPVQMSISTPQSRQPEGLPSTCRSENPSKPTAPQMSDSEFLPLHLLPPAYAEAVLVLPQGLTLGAALTASAPRWTARLLTSRLLARHHP